MKQLLLITFSLLLYSCGYKALDKSGAGDGQIDPSTQVFAQAFKDRSIQYGKPIKLGKLGIRFNPKLSGTATLGQCYMTYSGTQGQVEINPAFWNSQYTTIEMKEELIFHELGHCILDRDHDDSTVNVAGTSLNTSIMSTYFLSTYYYKANYEAYMTELFKRVISSSYVLSSNVSSFPINYYASAEALTAPLVVGKIISAKAIYKEDHSVSNDPDEMYKDISHFGCDEHDQVL